MVWLGPVSIAAVVLGAAGIGKLARPAVAVSAWRELGLPGGTVAVRCFGAIELLVALRVLAVAGAAALGALAVVYVALAVAAERLRRHGVRRAPGAGGAAVGCGCFGQAATPVGRAHVVLNVVAAATATAALAARTDGLLASWPRLPAAGVGHAVLVLTGAAAAIAMLTVLPTVRQMARPAPGPDVGVHLFGPTIRRKAAGADTTAAVPVGQDRP